MTGELFFNYYDADDTWGIIMWQGAFSALITPPPAKSYIINESRTRTGKEYDTTLVRMDERQLSLPLAIRATSRDAMYRQLMAFSQSVLETGMINITTKYQQNVVYRCVYKSITQLTEFNGRLAKFILTLVEPDPSDRVLREIVSRTITFNFLSRTDELNVVLSGVIYADVSFPLYNSLNPNWELDYTIPSGETSFNVSDLSDILDYQDIQEIEHGEIRLSNESRIYTYNITVNNVYS